MGFLLDDLTELVIGCAIRVRAGLQRLDHPEMYAAKRAAKKR